MSQATAPTSLGALRARAATGLPLGDVTGLTGPLARRLALVERLGAPLLPELDRALDDAAADAEVSAEVRVATAQARAVATGLLAAPLVLALPLSAVLSVDLLGFYGGGPGRMVLAVAGLLHGAGQLWVRALVAVTVRGAQAGDDDVEVIRLVAVGVRAGLALPAALREAAAAGGPEHAGHRRLALALEAGVDLDATPDLGGLRDLAATAVALGAPAGEALDRLAADLRRERRTRARERVGRLPVLLTPPTALLVLPATLLLVGAPIVAQALATLAG